MKKIIALLTVITMLLGVSLVPGGVYSEEKSEITLKQAIEIAKKTLSLNTEGFEFNSSYIENQNGYNLWSLSWNNVKTNNENINVSVDSKNGEIISVSRYFPYEQPKSRIPKYTRAEALGAAEAWAEKLQGEKFKLTRPSENLNQDYYNKYSDVYSFVFVRVKDDIEVSENNITVQLDKNNLKLRNFNILWDNASLPDKTKAISLDKAKEQFISKLGLELSYSFVYDNQSNEPRAILTYTLKKGNNPIDALTGEILNNIYRIYFTSEKAMDTPQPQQNAITPQEQTELDNNSKYITKETAEQVFRQYMSIDKDMKLESANLYSGYQNTNASWNLAWRYTSTDGKSNKYASAQIDALTKEFRSFYSGNYGENPEKGKTEISRDQAKKIAEEFLMKVQPDKFKNTQYKEQKELYKIMPAYQNGYSFSFIRTENNIPVPSNSLTVTVNEYTGEIISYYTNWTKADFPAPDKAISLDKAYEALFGSVKFSMQYIYHYPNANDYSSKEIKLAYALEKIDILMDANSGQMLNNDGTPVKKAEKLEYTDIKGNKAEEEIKILIDMGILTPDSTEYSPDSKIMQKDFVKLLINSLQEYYPISPTISENEYDNYYNEAIRRKLLAENQKNPDSVVAREDAARMLVRALNYGVLAEKDIFNAGFKDASKIAPAFKGYVVIAAELDILTPVNSYIYPKESITRGDAAEIIVNYLRVETSL